MTDARIEAIIERLKGDDMLILAVGRDDAGSVTLTRGVTATFALRTLRSVLTDLDDSGGVDADARAIVTDCLAVLARLDADDA